MAVLSLDGGARRRRWHIPIAIALCIGLCGIVVVLSSPQRVALADTGRAWLDQQLGTWGSGIAPDISFRKHLELLDRTRNNITASDTLAFDRIYVVSLSKRTDRREKMSKLARALGLDFTFFDATDGKDQGPGQAAVAWIAERIVEERAHWQQWIRALPGKSRTRFTQPALTARTAEEYFAEYGRPATLSRRFAKRGWLSQVPQSAGRGSLDQAWGNRPWTEWLQIAQRSLNASEWVGVEPKEPDADITAILREPNNKPFRQLTPGVLATWNSHWRLMSLIEARNETSLVLEDDVDFEWDIGSLWGGIKDQMERHKVGWDMTFLGHCWGDELAKPATIHPLLHPSTRPKCLHAYAITGRAVTRMRSHMLNPRTAYQSAVDQELPILIQSGQLGNVFSIVPPLIIQAKDSPTDVQLDSVSGGTGSNWHGVLRDSVSERIWQDEHPGETYVEHVGDPRTDPALRVGMHIVPKANPVLSPG